MRQPHLRLICFGLAAVAIGAGAGFAFLQTFPADAAPPVPAASPATEPAAASSLPRARQPAAVREGTPAPGQIYPGQIYPGQIYPGQIYPGQIYPGQIYPGQIYSAPPPPPPVGEPAKPATAGKKYAPPPRSKLATSTPHITIDADAIAEAIADAGVPVRIRRWHFSW
jgi:hypothetical protein